MTTEPNNYAQPEILIVDDEQSILDSLKDIIAIENPSLKITTVRTAEEAIEYLMTHQISVLITDLKLPGINGVELLESLTFVSPQTKGILMTAYGDRTIRSQASASGCRGYLEKPFEIDKLLNHLSSILYGEGKVQSANDNLRPLLKSCAEEEKNCILQVFCPQGSGHISVTNGTVIDAKFEEVSGAEALLLLLDAESTVVTTLPAATSGNYRTVIPARVLITVLSLSSIEERRMYLQNQLPYLYKNNVSSEEDGKKRTPKHKTEVHKFLTQGMQHYRAGRYEDAKFCWSSALKQDPNCKEAPIYLNALRGLTLTE